MDDIKLMVKAVQDYVGRCMAPFAERLKAIEQRPAPKDGKDADPALIRAEVEKAIAAIPKPRDGEPGKDADPATVIRAVAEAMAALPKPQDGKSVSPEEIDAMVARAVAQIPAAKDGESVSPEAVRAMVEAAVAAMPKPADGKSVTAEELEPFIAEQVRAAVAAIPPAKDGKDADPEHVAALVAQAVSALPAAPAGKDADPAVIKAMVAEAVAALPKPQDGKSVTPEDMLPVLESVVAKWALDFERRAADVLQRAAERIPVPKDGRDALELDDLSFEHDGDGGVTLKFQRGELVKAFTIQLPRFKDCGVFRDDVENKHKAGDGVTWGGSYWIAQKDAPDGKPGEGDGWRLAVKKGRDGKDLRPAEPVAPRQPVKLQ